MIGPTTTPEPGSLRSASLLTDPVLQAMAVGVAVVRVADLTVVESNPAWTELFAPTPQPQVLYSPADAEPETAARPIRRALSRDGQWIGTVRAPAFDFTEISPSLSSQPRETRMTPFSASTSSLRSARSSPRRSPA